MCDVLLLEDNPDVLELVHMALELRGYVVRVSEAPDCTLRYLESGGPCQLLLTDVDLGRTVNGFAVVDEARQVRPGLPAIYYSGHEKVPPGRELSANERYLEKPFSRLALFELLDELGVRASGTPLSR